MTPTAHYQMFGHYNAWANGRLYEAAAALSTEHIAPIAEPSSNRSTAP
jgi:uncharacterized damage-inducible protein DinB